MRAIFGLVLLVGMGLAGFAVMMVKDQFDQQADLVQRERDRAASAIVTVDVYSPTRALTYGEEITSDDVRLIKYARDFLPEGVFQTEEELFPEGTTVLRIATRPIEVNEPILASKVTAPGASRGIPALLDPGTRPFMVPDNVSAAFGADLRPTDRVDILWDGTVGNRAFTQLIKSSLEVIAVNEPDENGRGAGTGVVLQVSPEDFTDLTRAQNSGRLIMTVAGTNDTAVLGNIETDIETVLGIEQVVVEEVIEEVQEVCYRTERRGTERVQIETPCEE